MSPWSWSRASLNREAILAGHPCPVSRKNGGSAHCRSAGPGAAIADQRVPARPDKPKRPVSPPARSVENGPQR